MRIVKRNTGDSAVYSLATIPTLSSEQLRKKYPTVFSEGISLLEGSYHIRLDPAVDPVQHACRRVPVPLRDNLKHTLDDLVRQDAIAPVTKPIPCVNSMVVVPKKNGTLRICLDPNDLNKAIRREHYPRPTIEEVTTQLHGEKLFTILDVSKGFWHVPFDEQLSFHTQFYRYHWKRMPFGICSAPEVFQR